MRANDIRLTIANYANDDAITFEINRLNSAYRAKEIDAGKIAIELMLRSMTPNEQALMRALFAELYGDRAPPEEIKLFASTDGDYLTVAQFIDDWNSVYITINSPDSLYGTNQKEAYVMACDIHEKLKAVRRPPHKLRIIEAYGKLEFEPDYIRETPEKRRLPTAEEAEEWRDTGKVSNVLGWRELRA